MSDFQIESSTRQRVYNSDEYGQAKLAVEVHDFHPCLNSWEYRPPENYESILGEVREMPAEYRGKDILHCSINLHAEFGAVKQSKFVSLRRGIRRGLNNEPTYESSAMLRDEKGIYIRPDKDENLLDHHGNNHQMMWEIASENPFTLDDQLDMLIREGHRVFEPRVPTEI